MGGDQFRAVTLEHSFQNFEFSIREVTRQAPPVSAAYRAGIGPISSHILYFATENAFNKIIARGTSANRPHIGHVPIVYAYTSIGRSKIPKLLIELQAACVVQRADLLDRQRCSLFDSYRHSLIALVSRLSILDLTLKTNDHLRQRAKCDLAIASQRFQQLTLAKNIAQLGRNAHPCVESTAGVLVKVPDPACHDMLILYASL
ncbi:hypothetical protein GCM10007285_21540 [Stappia taiwanensis]|nr:hypothetical protein GCM10007285_21540 [Stappia taiwanensis]